MNKEILSRISLGKAMRIAELIWIFCHGYKSDPRKLLLPTSKYLAEWYYRWLDL